MNLSRVFIDVDVQRDFCDPAGALRVPGSPNDAFAKLTAFAADQRIPIIGSVDSHAWDAWEFASNPYRGPNGEKPNFPDHCVKGTAGWLKMPGTLPSRFRFVPNVANAPPRSLVQELQTSLTQAIYFEKEVYSLFANPMAEPLLAALCADNDVEFFVYGVATDYCVKAAVLGLLERGYKTSLITDAIAGISQSGVQQAVHEMQSKGVRLTVLPQVLAGGSA